MVLSVVPARTVQDGTALEYYLLTVTSAIDQTVSFYIDATLVASMPFTANEPQSVELEDPVKTEGIRELRVVGAVAGEWRGVVAWTGTRYFITFVDEEGREVAPTAVYVNLDDPRLVNTKRARETIQATYTLAGRWVLEVMLGEPDGFRYDIIDLAAITEDTTVTLPLLKEAYVQMSMDLGYVWPWIVRAAGALDAVIGTVAEALGYKDYPCLAAWIINYLFQNIKYPPYAWELRDDVLYVTYRITRHMIGIASWIIALVLIAIIVSPIVVYFTVREYKLIKKAEADKARAEATKVVAEETSAAVNRWLTYAEEQGLTPYETQRGLEAISAAYTQMSQNLEPKFVIPPILVGIFVLAVLVAILLAIVRG